jgi:hypothetical protein
MGLFGNIFSLAMCLGVIAVSIWLSIYYLGDRNSLPEQLPKLPEDLRDYLPDIELFHKEDPFFNVSEADANRWPNNDGSGLDLHLINALDDFWYDYFDLAVQEWDSGSPDALTLSSEVAQADSECTTVDGVIKVCNGDYGETDWKGRNCAVNKFQNVEKTLNLPNCDCLYLHRYQYYFNDKWMDHYISGENE